MNHTLGHRGHDSCDDAPPLDVLRDSRTESRLSTDTTNDEDATLSKHDSALSAAGIILNNSSASKRDRVKSLGHEAKARAKRFLRNRRLSPQEVEADEDEDHDDPYVDIRGNAAFEPGEVVGNNRIAVGGTADRTIGTLSAGIKAIIHPGHAIKRKAATTVAVQDRPYLSQNADQEFLEAHKGLAEAELACGGNAEGDARLKHHQDKVKELEELRESRKVAWITSRHVERALVVSKRDLPTPKKEDYTFVDENGKQQLDWKAWLYARQHSALKRFAINAMGHVDTAGEPPFDKEVLALYIERILISSSPWQSWICSLRQTYRWEDPRSTGKWLVVWCLVWYLDYTVTFILAYVVFIVLENKYRPQQVKDLRESYDRALYQGTTAFRFNELIHKHGTDKWLDPLVDSMGPKIQIQISDLADFLEILNNFYDWTIPEKTWATIFWFLTAILLGVLTPTGYSLKIVWMFCLLSFFLGRPIASLNPAYRHTVNALGWIFWDIPNDADWSLMYLRSKAQATRERLISQTVEEKYKEDVNSSAAERYFRFTNEHQSSRTNLERNVDAISDSDADSWHTVESSTSVLGGLDIMSFRCHEDGIKGRITIYSDGLRFERSNIIGKPCREIWRRSWHGLVEIRKVNFSTAAKIFSAEGLHLTYENGIEVRLEGVKQRDRAFNCIVGFSGLPFQVLRPVAAASGGDKFIGDTHDQKRREEKS
ncbi:hypothetical protein MBLNU459_g1562t1 [Dothideomycetes sp. NU459]